MINNVTLVGRLTKDADLKYTQTGNAVATFTLAVNRTFTNAQGEKEADFINCVVWRKSAENVANYTQKGSLVGVTGRIQTRSYDNDAGTRIYVTEVVAENVQFLDSKKDGEQRQSNNNYQSNNQRQTSGNDWGNGGGGNTQTKQNSFNRQSDPFAGSSIDISDDDLPF